MLHWKKIIAFFSILTLLSHSSHGQRNIPCFESAEAKYWADSVFKTMSYAEKMGQLFMVDAFSNKDVVHVAQITQLIDSFKIGGLIFFQGGPLRQANLTNFYQSHSKIPLLIGIDGEWGLSMRLDSTIRFPRQMTLGAGASAHDVYEMGVEIASQCKRMGIHINFAPDIDINNNPNNPIINSRAFGENKEKVALYGLNYMKGMQDHHVMACAKHFPGHGDTDTDSHLSLPVVNASTERLDSLELFPFMKLIPQGLASVMVAHLFIPGLDSTLDQPSSLSTKIVKDLLKTKLGFEGLVFTDALNMKGVSSYVAPGEIELKALLAGNDVLLYPQDVAKAINRIHFAIQNCEIEQEEIDFKVMKILSSKYWAGLNNYQPIQIENLQFDLNSPGAIALNNQLYENAPTLLKNENNLLPLHPSHRDCIASVVLNDTLNNPFQIQLSKYGPIKTLNVPKDASDEYRDSIYDFLKGCDHVIVSIHNTTINAQKNFGLTAATIELTEMLGKLKGSILCVFGNAYVLGRLQGLKNYDAIVEGYEDTNLPLQQTAQKIYGGQLFTGQLPVSILPEFNLDQGVVTRDVIRLKYTIPEDAGISTLKLAKIDSAMVQAIRDSVFPGAQIVIAKDGKVVYDKSFGWHTYDKITPVKNSDVYDIASLTKIYSTALAAMYLFDKKKLDLDEKASHYLSSLRKSDKKDMTIRQLMAHEAGLKSWVPFWKETFKDSILDPEIYCTTYQRNFKRQVADSLFISDDYEDVMWDKIVERPLENPGKYVYSDLGIIILQKVIEKISGKDLDELVNDVFYKPLGLWKIGYHPLTWIDKSQIVPTELDTAFRHQLIHGYVHDPAAALMGGVGGHAGVFSNAESLAVLMQMLLNGGEYGDKRYLKSETVSLFTSPAYADGHNRRALFFDKPDLAAGANGPSATGVSLSSFGHSGFTGTYSWADPQTRLQYIFLSNRVYPTSTNLKLAKSNLRTNIMQMAIEAIESK